MRGFVILCLLSGLLACKRATNDTPSVNTTSPGPGSSKVGSGGPPGPSNVGSGALPGPKVAPPFDLKQPPADATKTASGLVYKKLVENPTGIQPRRNDTVLIRFTGWDQTTGETFYSDEGSRGDPKPLNLAQAAPGFTEALQLLRVGEKALVWMPPEIGYKTPAADGKARVYQINVVEVQQAPAIPDDVASPPGNATTLASGIKFIMVHPGTGTEKVRSFDTATFHFTVWDDTGRMIDSTEPKKHPTTSQPYKQSPGMSDMLTALTVGARGRFWVDAEKLTGGPRPPPGVQHGLLCYEVEVTQVTKVAHEPPPTPPDVAKPPADAKKTAKGVFYKLLAPGPGKDPRHPTPNNLVKVNYTGWTTDGKMFDSSFLTGQPAQFNLHNVIAGWTDGIPMMMIGDHMRFWIPEELAYKGQAGKPQGMLVFDVELLEIVDQTGH